MPPQTGRLSQLPDECGVCRNGTSGREPGATMQIRLPWLLTPAIKYGALLGIPKPLIRVP